MVHVAMDLLTFFLRACLQSRGGLTGTSVLGLTVKSSLVT